MPGTTATSSPTRSTLWSERGQQQGGTATPARDPAHIYLLGARPVAARTAAPTPSGQCWLPLAESRPKHVPRSSPSSLHNTSLGGGDHQAHLTRVASLADTPQLGSGWLCCHYSPTRRCSPAPLVTLGLGPSPGLLKAGGLWGRCISAQLWPPPQASVLAELLVALGSKPPPCFLPLASPPPHRAHCPAPFQASAVTWPLSTNHTPEKILAPLPRALPPGLVFSRPPAGPSWVSAATTAGQRQLCQGGGTGLRPPLHPETLMLATTPSPLPGASGSLQAWGLPCSFLGAFHPQPLHTQGCFQSAVRRLLT